jgi:hypothetical protein
LPDAPHCSNPPFQEYSNLYNPPGVHDVTNTWKRGSDINIYHCPLLWLFFRDHPTPGSAPHSAQLTQYTMRTHHPQRSILITGCSDGGLGAALAEAFHETGRWRVIASARDLTKLQGLKGLKNGQKGGGIEQVQLDVVDEASVRAAVVAVQKLLADGGDGGRDGQVVGLDAICLNAGGGYSVSCFSCSVSWLPSSTSYSDLLDILAPTLTHFTPIDATDGHPAILTFTPCRLQPQRLLPAEHAQLLPPTPSRRRQPRQEQAIGDLPHLHCSPPERQSPLCRRL